MQAISEQVSVGPQVLPEELADLKAQGFTQIICNRPDGEGPDQPSFASMETAATAAGMKAYYAPFIAGDFPIESLNTVIDALATGEKTAMYCLSGTRSVILWAAREVLAGRDVESVINDAAQIGYGIGQLHGFFDSLAERR